MKRVFISAFLCMSIMSAICSNGKTDSLRMLFKEKLNVIFSCPKGLVKGIGEESSLRFEFGKTLDEFPTTPIFYGGFLVEFSEDCSAVVMDIKNMKKPRAESYPKDREYETPEARAQQFYANFAQFYPFLQSKGMVWAELNEFAAQATQNLFENQNWQVVEIIADIRQKPRILRAQRM